MADNHVSLQDEIIIGSQEGFNCAQIVFGHFAEDIGLEEDLAKKTAACFGGGMYCGEVCGAVTGALMAIGLKYGNGAPYDNNAKKLVADRVADFQELFSEEYGSIICRDLLDGLRFGDPEDMVKIQERGLLMKVCPGVIAYAIRCVTQVFGDD